ncbi:MAG: hypothetical protein K2X11_03125 [Acetobacteraceae bacterium]|nr:hypothetical protein [Acetobacteraceae bacterium]
MSDFDETTMPKGHHVEPRTSGGLKVRLKPGQWTPPTYYPNGYSVTYQIGVGTVTVKERHYDPRTHKLLKEVDREIPDPDAGSNTITRPPGTYISIQNTTSQEFDADKDY